MKENEVRYPVLIDASMMGPDGALKPEAYQRLLIQAQEPYRVANGYDIATLKRKYGMSWVLLALTVEIKRQLRMGERLSVTICCTEITEVLYRHDLGFYDQNGQLVMVAAKFHGILNTDTRRLCKNARIRNLLQCDGDRMLLEAESRCSLDLRSMEQVDERRIYPSWIDMLGHVNNLRYGELINDSLSHEMRGRMIQLKRMEIYFLREMRQEATVSMHRKDRGDLVEMAGTCQADGLPSFYARLFFSRT